MILLTQREEPVCGQTCIAMVLDLSLTEACSLIGHRKGTHAHELVKCLDDYLMPGHRLEFGVPGMPVQRSLKGTYILRHREDGESHWSVLHHGRRMDPAWRECPWPVCSYIEVLL